MMKRSICLGFTLIVTSISLIACNSTVKKEVAPKTGAEAEVKQSTIESITKAPSETPRIRPTPNALTDEGCSETTSVPTEEPTIVPTEEQTKLPTEKPTTIPTEEPTKKTTSEPKETEKATKKPTTKQPETTSKKEEETTKPTEKPKETEKPKATEKATTKPTETPKETVKPTEKPKSDKWVRNKELESKLFKGLKKSCTNEIDYDDFWKDYNKFSPEQIATFNSICEDFVAGKKTNNETKKRLLAEKRVSTSEDTKAIVECDVVKVCFEGKDISKLDFQNLLWDKYNSHISLPHYLFVQAFYNEAKDTTTVYYVIGRGCFLGTF